MSSQAEIKQAILKVAGNPESGPIKDLADAMARAIVELDAEPARESRVITVAEKR
jgi:hypothetical protein